MKLNKNNYPYYAIGKKCSYSSLKAMSKDDLIDYLDTAQHNYECANESLYYLRQYAEKLDKALDRACLALVAKDNALSMFMPTENVIKEEWREYLMKVVEKMKGDEE